MRTPKAARSVAVLLVLAEAGLLTGATWEFYQIAWGSGTWLGQFSVKWAAAFALFVVFSVACLVGTSVKVWPRAGSTGAASSASGRRIPAGARWFGALLLIILPIWFLQYTPWGVVFSGPFLRVMIWLLAAAAIAYLLMPTEGPWRFGWGCLTALLLSGSGFGIASGLSGVTTYPFSLGWSEGNRLWDYSLLFGKTLYSYGAGSEPMAYLDLGRQLVGGLPFLLPHVSIFGERLWLGVTNIAPYLLLGLTTFWATRRRDARSLLLLALWTFMFLSQGPIHTPLLLWAVLVVIAWIAPLWLAVILVAGAGYFAEVSRFTWMFAPAMWAAMLEIGGAHGAEARFFGSAWRRATIRGAAGLAGAGAGIVSGLLPGASSVQASAGASTSQALLWYRLFPNATYGIGILFGLALAVVPLVVVLAAVQRQTWRLTGLQQLALVLPLTAFLIVGLIVSTKIGGGGDLHNLDMFLIGLVLVAAIAWRTIGEQGLGQLVRDSPGGGIVLLLLVAMPAFQPLMSLRPLSFSQDAAWIAVLADVDRPRDLGSLPDNQTVSSSLRELATAVRAAQGKGEVLFMDQRQLLTFGDITNVQLVSDYEKKKLMDEALSQNRGYFAPFYEDLAAHRFALIVTSPLRTPIKDSEYGFGEENNAWVRWVARPILCYYAEQDTLTEVKVELLTPKESPTTCPLP